MHAIMQAGAADMAACAALYERVGRGHFTWKPADTFRSGDFAAIAAEEDVWIIRRQSGLAALLTYYVPEHFVHLLFVEPAWRRAGHGQALLAHIQQHYRSAHTLKVNEENHTARAFYEHLGYTERERGDNEGLAWIRLVSPCGK